MKQSSGLILWWGYRHVEGTIHLKRYFGPEDVQDAQASPFVEQVCQPFEARDKETAWSILLRRGI